LLAHHFEKPLRILVGLGFPRQIDTVAEAYQCAIEHGMDSPERRAAIKACRAALAGDIEVETARGIFAAFARKTDLLIEDDFVLPQSAGRRESHA